MSQNTVNSGRHANLTRGSWPTRTSVNSESRSTPHVLQFLLRLFILFARAQLRVGHLDQLDVILAHTNVHREGAGRTEGNGIDCSAGGVWRVVRGGRWVWRVAGRQRRPAGLSRAALPWSRPCRTPCATAPSACVARLPRGHATHTAGVSSTRWIVVPPLELMCVYGTPSHMPSSPSFHASTTSDEPSLNLYGVEPVWKDEANIFLLPVSSLPT